jgi:hypothetical protein
MPRPIGEIEADIAATLHELDRLGVNIANAKLGGIPKDVTSPWESDKATAAATLATLQAELEAAGE